MRKKIALCLTFIMASTLYADEFCEEREDYFSCCSSWKGGTFSIGGDWLYWKVEQQKMQVAADVTATSDPSGNTTVNSKVLKPKFKVESGYRIFADYTTPDDNWKITAAFTHVPSHAGFNHVGNPANISFDFVSIFNTNFPLLSAIAGDSFSSVSSRWNVDINYFDFDLSRRLSICEYLEIKPHIGIRGQWINQKFKINGTDTLVFRSTLKGKLQGIGLEGGLWGGWNIGCGFSVIGHIGGAIVYSKSDNRGVLVGTSGTTSTIRYSEHSHITLPGMDAFIGLAYTTQCYCGAINIHAGWEQHIIMNTNQFSIAGGGDMSEQGFTLGGSITY